MTRIKRAIVSVSDKEGLVPFCRFLHEQEVEIISTGGTARTLKENGIPITGISDYTGFPEMMDGRVKTLHPKVHGGLLGLRDNAEHQDAMAAHQIEPIDMVVVNLYPFEAVSSREGSTFEEVIENIDIGGPSMLRSAAKNYQSVAVVTSVSQYEEIQQAMQTSGGTLSDDLRKRLARQAYALTSRYDSLITNYLQKTEAPEGTFPEIFTLHGQKVQDLRYGENPHQEAAFYQLAPRTSEPAVTDGQQLQGKELSFNNILDLDGALNCVKEFEQCACVIVKHTNPCGVAVGDNLLTCFERAWAGDPVSAFGSIIAMNRPVDEATAKAITQYFVECVIAPGFDVEAKTVFQSKKNLRLLELPELASWLKNKKRVFDSLDTKKVTGGLLVQARDNSRETWEQFKVVTAKQPTESEIQDLQFGWKVVKHVKSNALVYVKNGATIGVGAGQMSRVDSAKIGVAKAVEGLDGAVLASDAFFPFRDAIDTAVENGIRAIIQPGGSMRDQEVIDACNEQGIAMIFTGYRHFRH